MSAAGYFLEKCVRSYGENKYFAGIFSQKEKILQTAKCVYVILMQHNFFLRAVICSRLYITRHHRWNSWLAVFQINSPHSRRTDVGLSFLRSMAISWRPLENIFPYKPLSLTCMFPADFFWDGHKNESPHVLFRRNIHFLDYCFAIQEKYWVTITWTDALQINLDVF